ncbi:hypothetical protein Tco_0153001 [Tanacetum coccineum]
MGPTPSSSSAMVLTLEKRRNDQPNVSSSVLSSASNMNMSLVVDCCNKYNYGDFIDGPEGNTRPTSNKDVAINADAQQQARAIALDKQQQLCKALPSVSRELEESLKLVKDVPDGASSTLINRDDECTLKRIGVETAIWPNHMDEFCNLLKNV